MEATKPANGLWRRLRNLLDAGLDVMARYPYDMSEIRWPPDLYYEPPEHPEGGGRAPSPSPQPVEPSRGRAIRVVRIVPPAVAPHPEEKPPTPIGSRRPKQPV